MSFPCDEFCIPRRAPTRRPPTSSRLESSRAPRDEAFVVASQDRTSPRAIFRTDPGLQYRSGLCRSNLGVVCILALPRLDSAHDASVIQCPWSTVCKCGACPLQVHPVQQEIPVPAVRRFQILAFGTTWPPATVPICWCD